MSPRPGRVERVITIDSPRPRGLDGRKRTEFIAISQEITEIFRADPGRSRRRRDGMSGDLAARRRSSIRRHRAAGTLVDDEHIICCLEQVWRDGDLFAIRFSGCG
jgi:hypothetical protein